MAGSPFSAVGSGRCRRDRRLLAAQRVPGLRAVAAGLTLALTASVLVAPPAWAARARHRPPPVQRTPSVPGRVVAARRPGPDLTAQRALRGPRPATRWPAAGSATVDLPAPSAAAPAQGASPDARRPVRAGALPVWLGPSTMPGGRPPSHHAAATASGVHRVRVELLEQAQSRRAGLRGLLLRVTRADGAAVAGRASVSVDYSSFRDAYGADWASRLRLATVPECALSTPQKAACQPTPVASSNDVKAGRVTADVTVPAAAGGQPGGARAGATAQVATGGGSAGLLAATAGPSGAAGDFSATSLSPSATWQAGGSTGGFTWSYPLRTPPSSGGPAPELALAYSSASVDGRTAASNNQPSWVGEGFELWPGYVERRYKACSDDLGGGANNTTKTGDECWGTDNAVLSLGGTATELVRDGATGAWHPRVDDGSRIEHLTGGANGDGDGEHWRVTTVNGTQYWFGLNRLPGWTAGRPETRSAWTVPVFGNNPGEPCHQASFDASWCQQAWRWNLDYVVDPHGNSMSYWYAPETNNYGRNLDPAKATPYTRGGTLAHIDYGTRTDAEFATPPARVVFGVADRCIPGAVCDPAHPASWPDTPLDQDCTAVPCTDKLAPTFWTTKRLATVTTQVWDGSSAYRNVDSWTLEHSFPPPGDGTRAGLWLAGITHTGLVGGSTAMPKLTFTGIQLNNRVDATGDQAPPMNWWRVSEIRTETGGVVSVGYSAPDCVPGSRMPASPDANTLRCFPVYWTKQGATSPTLDWFHKYVVANVSENDLNGGAPRVITTYQYLGTPAWHFDDIDGLVPLSRKSWAQWRGYATVRVLHGDPGEQTRTETLYFRGMDGDKLPSGTRSASVTDSAGGAWPDSDALAGMPREQITYDGADVVSGTISDPYLSDPTAKRTIDGTTVYARHTAVAASRTRTALDGGRGFRFTRTVNTFDAYGMVATTSDLGDEATADDNLCYRYTYARNTSAWLLSYQSRVEKYAQSCEKQPASSDDVISDARTSFDGAGWGTPPSKGDVTRVERLSEWSPSSGASYLTVSRAAYDTNGRLTDKWGVDDQHSTIAYTPASGGPVTKVTSTNPLGHTATAELEPGWGETTATVDPNGRRTDLAFDPLGRLTGVWLPGRTRGADSANLAYAYLVRADGATAVTSQRLNPAGGYVTSYTLYDGLLRPRQTQAPAAGSPGGRVLTDTFYDTAGQVVRTYGTYYNSASPSSDLFAPVNAAQVLDQTATAYDGAGRVTASIFQPGGHERWRTTTGYGGDRVDVTPPAGGTATSTVTDARDRTVELRQFHAATPTGAYDRTTYAFNRKGQLVRVTDPAGNQWRYGYDLRGRRTRVDDPDQGTTTSEYDDTDQLTSTTDARGQKLAYTYDALGRKTAVYKDAVDPANRLAGWVYDTLAKGHLTSSTRYLNGDAYTVAVRGYTSRYDPTGAVITIPAAEQGLAGTYTFQTSYKPDGSPAATIFPAAGGLPGETVQYGYNSLGLPSLVKSALGSYVSAPDDTGYNPFGQLLQYALATCSGCPTVYQTYSYQADTHRLDELRVDRDGVSPYRLAQADYSYDPAGNVTKLVDSPGGQSADTQCFGYDHLRRLTQAWTPASGDCGSDPTASALGGPAPYWQSWTYDLTGNRLTQTDHATSGGDVTTRYAYPDAGQAQPHTLLSTTSTDSTGTHTKAYDYDAAGNTLARPGANGTQKLTWDPEDHLATQTDGQSTHSFVYDADGNRLIRHDATGATLYLPGTELRLNAATSQVTATRYYNFAGNPVAVRTPSALTWLLSDHHGTSDVAVVASNQQASQRRQTPFGTPRGPQPTWPTEKGFVGGTTDPDGLTHLGAREYDPSTGRFVSVDPQIDQSDPQQMNGYAYANNTPITASDPDGRDYLFDPGNFDVTSSDGTSSIPTGSGNAGNAGNTGSQGAPPKGNAGGSGPWWNQAWNKANQGFKHAANWAEQHKAEIAGATVGLAVGIGCGVAIGWTGVGAIACGALAGAVASMVTYALATPEKERSVGGLLTAGLVGAVTGAAGGVIGRAAAPVVGAAARYAGARMASTAARVAVPKLTGGAAKAGEAAKAIGAFCSFSGGTRVLMADGTSKPIAKVKVGDRVLAADPRTGTRQAKRVTHIWVHRDTVEDLAVAGGRTVTTTKNHPFWDQTANKWEPAGTLRSGDVLVTAAGAALTVAGLRAATARTATAYNLTVADLHTYHVLVGDQPVLVHNTCGVELGDAKVGEVVYRVWGRDTASGVGSKPWGSYWSRVDPRTVANYRDSAGLPDKNAGRFLSIGRLRGVKGVERTPGGAAPLGNNAGGIDELLVPYPTLQVRLEQVIGLNPPL